ncbi:MAG: DedA family protein [Pseudomonadota bacterium]
MTLESFIRDYGYLAVFVGTFLEGETILLMAGFAAQRGFLSLPTVVAVAFLGAFVGDQLYFHLGRRHGPPLLARFPSLAERTERVRRLLYRYHTALIVALRFTYGMRIVGPMALGLSEVPPRRFLVLNLTGAWLWAALVAGAGYLFGQALELLVQDLKHFEAAIFGLMAAAGATAWLVLRRRKKHGPE